MTWLQMISARLHHRVLPYFVRRQQRLSCTLQRLEVAMTPLRERPLVCLFGGLLAGCVLGTIAPLTPWLIGLLLGVATVLARRWPWRRSQGCCRVFYLGLVLTHLCTIWQERAVPLDHITHLLATHSSRPLTVEGVLDRPIEPQGDHQRLYLRMQRYEGSQGWQHTSGLVRLNVHAERLPFLPGDRLRVSRLRLRAVRGFQNPGAFDFQRFMQRQGINAVGGVSNPARISLQQRPPGWSLSRRIELWRQQLHTHIRTTLLPPYDGMFLAMILGHRGQLSPAVEEVFRRTGTAHLLVVSGLNVGFIAGAFLVLWRTCLREVRCRLPRSWLPGWRPTPLALILLLPPLLLYCTLVGWQVPTTRAALMLGSATLALALGRTQEIWQALLLAAALILLLDPAALFMPGFQLSFVAVASLLLASRLTAPTTPAAALCQRWGNRLKGYILLSSAAFFGTLPILASLFHTIPTWGIPANLLLVPLAGLLVPAGVLALALVSLWPSLSAVVLSPFAIALSWMLRLTEALANLPGAQLYVPTPSWAMLLGYYGSLAVLLLWPPRRVRLYVVSTCAVVFMTALSWQYLGTRPRQLRVTFLDVGSGDAIFVQTPGNHTLLIDGGGSHDGRFDIGRQVIAPFLWDRYVRRFDLLALTHPEANHARGLASVLQLFPTTHLLTNGTPLTASYLSELRSADRYWGTQSHTALDGRRDWQWERLRLTVLAPPSREEQLQTPWRPPTENDRSLVLRLQYGSVRLLCTGDIQHFTERWLLAHRSDLQADILQIPHHGSKTSTLPAFVQHVRPQVAIMSLGAGNTYGHPHPQVLRVLTTHNVPVFRTDQHGAITITSDGTHFQVTPFRPYRPALTATGTSLP
jgi:competence protein ComEC